MVRDSIADRKGLRKPVRLIKSERPHIRKWHESKDGKA